MVVVELHAKHGVRQRLDDDALNLNSVFLSGHMTQAYSATTTPVMVSPQCENIACMRCVLQRASHASVAVGDEIVGSIGTGLLVLIGVAPDDSEVEARWLVDRITRMRIFNDDDGRFNRSVLDVGGSLLVVSQFTLFADTKRGTRPGFSSAAEPGHARAMYEQFCDIAAAQGLVVERGVFGAHMHVSLVNDGPVTIVIERTAADAAVHAAQA